jgi:hypothetical protein
MQGRSSGVEVEYDYWLATLRNRRAIRLQWFDTGTGLEAAGLSR